MTFRALIKVWFCLFVCLAVGACSFFEERRKVDYKTSRTLPPLEVPPDLTSLPDTAPVAATTPSQTFSDYAADRTPAASSSSAPAVLPPAPNVRIERERGVRWLVVQAGAESLWPSVRQFVTDAGLGIERENPTAGVLETQWIASRLPGSSTAATATRLGWYYPLASRYKFRIRLERGAQPGATEVYVSAFGQEQVVGATPSWRGLEPDGDVEAEMLSLLMAHLGKPEVQARAMIAQKPAAETERARMARRGDSFMLELNDTLERAWRRVGLSLDRVGFTVEDRNRSRGIYYVRYLDPDKATDEPGWFARLFGAEAKKPEERYQIHLQAADAGTSVVVRSQDGAPEFGRTSERILGLLYEQLK